ncbi:MAG: agmatinase [Candidatus Omnitrophica bacterium]|nr:agmatinase [Candidatus Omnitrophota bacterium]
MKHSYKIPDKLSYLKRTKFPMNFLGLPPELSNYKNARVVVQPLPYEGTVSYTSGTSDGPFAIIHASRFIEDFDDEQKRSFSQLGVHTLPFLNPPKKQSPPEPYIRRVFEQTRKLVRDGKFVISLGGEHSISAGIIWAFAEKYPKLSVLHIDAHGDLRDEYEGNAFSHACGLRRVADRVKTVHVGMREVSRDQWEFVKKKKIKMLFAYEMHRMPRKQWIREVVGALGRDVYITCDTDGFDPTVIPSTGTPEPGGLSYVDVLDLFREIGRRKNIVGFDIMELAPRPEFHFPDYTCARLAYKMITFKFRQKK